jgi:hypothetical protein
MARLHAFALAIAKPCEAPHSCAPNPQRVVLRRVAPDQSYVRVYREAPGLAENGLLAMLILIRIDGGLAFTDRGGSATPPIRLLENHS